MAGGQLTVLASSSAAIAAVSVASLVIGYGLLAGLWYFVFSPGAERRARRRDQGRGERLPPDPGDAPAAPPPVDAPAAHGGHAPPGLRHRARVRRRQ